MKTLGLLGFGAFGRFMAKHLTPHFAVRAWNRSPIREAAAGVEAVDFAAAAGCDIVIVAVTMNGFAEVAERAAAHVVPGALVADVASVKARPVELLRQYMPPHADILGLHPMFGPQSGADGIAGLRCAMCPVRIADGRLARARAFLADTLHLAVIDVDPIEHDREMARVQAVTHFVSRGLKELGLGLSPLATKAYEQLQRFADILLSDSWELFLTIENENPYARAMRARFCHALQELELRLAESAEPAPPKDPPPA